VPGVDNRVVDDPQVERLTLMSRATEAAVFSGDEYVVAHEGLNKASGHSASRLLRPTPDARWCEVERWMPSLDQNNIGVSPLSRQFGGLGVQLVSPQGNGALYQDYVGTVAHPLGDLAADGLFARFGAGIQMEITGLDVGTYQMTTWHHSSVDLRPGGFNILTSVNHGALNLVASGIVQSLGLAPTEITEATFEFELTNPGASLQVTLSSGNNPDVMTVLGGFRITAVPEPSGLGLLCSILPLFRLRREVNA